MAATVHSDRRSDGQNPSPNLFEFSTAAPEMCAADDVIVRGKLLPLWAPPPPQPKKSKTPVHDFSECDHRRSNSSGERPRGSLGGKDTAGYRKLRRGVSESGPDPGKPPRPRWYVLNFGSVRVPAEMEMKEIRIRQQRRIASPPPQRNSREWGPWKFLQSLSCKGMEAAAAVVA